MTWVATVGGLVLLGLGLVDLFLVVLYLRGGAGLVAPRLAEAVWSVVRAVAERAGARRDRLLSFAGPLSIVAIAASWGLLVLLGCALLVWPALGSGVRASSGATPTGFDAALYFAAMSLTTLGTGDLVPRTPAARLGMVAMAALGFASLTLVVTYVLSVYTALLRRTTFATDVHHRTGGTGDAAEYVARASAGGDPSFLQQDLLQVLQEIVRLYEAHRFYPVLHYFRYLEPRYALPRITFVLLDAATLAATLLDEEGHAAVVRGVAVPAVRDATREMLGGLEELFLDGEVRADSAPAEEAAWRERYVAARERLAAEGVRLAPAEAGAEAYVRARRGWQPWIEAFAERFGYDVDRILRRDDA